MLVLQERQACPHSTICPYNELNTCNGANSVRENVFECNLVNGGVFVEQGSQRSQLDLTGKMKVLLG